jgi:hypothetical protein
VHPTCAQMLLEMTSVQRLLGWFPRVLVWTEGDPRHVVQRSSRQQVPGWRINNNKEGLQCIRQVRRC